MAKVRGDSVRAWFFGRRLFDLRELDQIPCCICFMWPISLASSMAMNLLMDVVVIPGHPLRETCVCSGDESRFWMGPEACMHVLD